MLGGGKGRDGGRSQTQIDKILPYLLGGGVANHTGELVQPAQKPFGRALTESDLDSAFTVPTANDQNGAILHPSLGLGDTNRQVPLSSRPLGLAEQVEGTVHAPRLTGDTDQRTQLDQALGEIARIGGGHKRGKGSLCSFLGCGREDIGIIPRETSQYSKHVAVHGGDGNIISDGGHRSCGVATHTGELQESLKISGDHATVTLHNGTGGLLQIATAVGEGAVAGNALARALKKNAD